MLTDKKLMAKLRASHAAKRLRKINTRALPKMIIKQ
jgi:hypothetical protein